MRKFPIITLTVLTLAAPLSACQTPEESAMNAEATCSEQGLRPGTERYRRCVNATYRNNRIQSQQAENAAVAGAAVGVIGGALVGAAIADDNDGYYYHHHHHHHWHHW
jgi:hypothetical protein